MQLGEDELVLEDLEEVRTGLSDCFSATHCSAHPPSYPSAMQINVPMQMMIKVLAQMMMTEYIFNLHPERAARSDSNAQEGTLMHPDAPGHTNASQCTPIRPNAFHESIRIHFTTQ